MAAKDQGAINRRVEMLGQMNDRHIRAVGNQDKQALKELAIEYRSLKCPHMAKKIEMEARAIRKRKADPTPIETAVTA